jgi:TolA-binding protein
MRFFFIFLLMVIALVGCSRPSAEEMFNQATDAQKAGQYDDAITAYQELAKTYPDSARAPEAVYALGAIYQNHKRSYHESIQAFRLLVEKYPNHATAANASFLIGFIYNNDLKNIDSARIAYVDFIKRYPANQLVTSAQFEMSNLGKDPTEVLNAQAQMAQEELKPLKKRKK